MELTPGIRVKLHTKKGDFECVILESPQSDVVLIKLNSGYNIHYVGLNLAFSNLGIKIPGDIDEDDTAFSYGIQAGLDYFLTDNVSINPELRYTKATYDFHGEDIDVSSFKVLIGIAAHF